MKQTFLIIIIFTLLFLPTSPVHAHPSEIDCLKVKIFSKDKAIDFKDRDKYVIHFQLENCGTTSIPIDFYANIGYSSNSSCNIYFTIDRSVGEEKQYKPYNYELVDYANMVDSIMILRPRRIYTFYLPLFHLYEIQSPGHYRLQGFYRFMTNKGTYYTQASNYLYIEIQ